MNHPLVQRFLLAHRERKSVRRGGILRQAESQAGSQIGVRIKITIIKTRKINLRQLMTALRLSILSSALWQ